MNGKIIFFDALRKRCEFLTDLYKTDKSSNQDTLMVEIQIIKLCSLFGMQ